MQDVYFSLHIVISLASFLWDIGRQCKTRPAASDQVLHCLETEVYFKI